MVSTTTRKGRGRPSVVLLLRGLFFTGGSLGVLGMGRVGGLSSVLRRQSLDWAWDE